MTKWKNMIVSALTASRAKTFLIRAQFEGYKFRYWHQRYNHWRQSWSGWIFPKGGNKQFLRIGMCHSPFEKQAVNNTSESEDVARSLTNLEELSFLTVLAFPKASRMGLACSSCFSSSPWRKWTEQQGDISSTLSIKSGQLSAMDSDLTKQTAGSWKYLMFCYSLTSL